MTFTKVSDSALGRMMMHLDITIDNSIRSVSKSGSSSSSSNSSHDSDAVKQLKDMQKAIHNLNAIFSYFNEGKKPDSFQLLLCIKNLHSFRGHIQSFYSPASLASMEISKKLRHILTRIQAKHHDISLQKRLLVTELLENHSSVVHKVVSKNRDGHLHWDHIKQEIIQAINECPEVQFKEPYLSHRISSHLGKHFPVLSISHKAIYECLVEMVFILHGLPDKLELLMPFFNPLSLNRKISIPFMNIQLTYLSEAEGLTYNMCENEFTDTINLQHLYNDSMAILLKELQQSPFYPLDTQDQHRHDMFRAELEFWRQLRFSSRVNAIIIKKDMLKKADELLHLKLELQQWHERIRTHLLDYEHKPSLIMKDFFVQREHAVHDIIFAKNIKSELVRLDRYLNKSIPFIDRKLHVISEKWKKMHHDKAGEILGKIQSVIFEYTESSLLAKSDHPLFGECKISLQDRIKMCMYQIEKFQGIYANLDTLHRDLSKLYVYPLVLDSCRLELDSVLEPLLAEITAKRAECNKAISHNEDKINYLSHILASASVEKDQTYATDISKTV